MDNLKQLSGPKSYRDFGETYPCYSKVPVTFGPENLFCVCLIAVCTSQDQSFSNLENDTIKLSVNEVKPVCDRGTQREYSSKPLKHSIVKRILVFKR